MEKQLPFLSNFPLDTMLGFVQPNKVTYYMAWFPSADKMFSIYCHYSDVTDIEHVTNINTKIPLRDGMYSKLLLSASFYLHWCHATKIQYKIAIEMIIS